MKIEREKLIGAGNTRARSHVQSLAKAAKPPRFVLNGKSYCSHCGCRRCRGDKQFKAWSS